MNKKPTALPPGTPYAPVEYEVAMVAAVQQLMVGGATVDQQQMFMTWLVNTACGTYDLSYRPSGDRDTAFAEGRRFVGLTIVKLNNLNLRSLTKEKMRHEGKIPTDGASRD